MNCLKCGRDTVLGQVFCKECLAHMEQHPVKPGSTLILPNRSAATPSRRVSHSRKNRTPEEKVTRLRKLVMIQMLALLAVMAAFIITVAIMSGKLGELDIPFLPGQNYSTVESTVETT